MTESSTASPIDLLKEKFSAEILEVKEDRGETIAVIRKDRCHDILRFLKEGLSFELLVDLTGIDYLSWGATPRFEVVYQLYSLTHDHRMRVRVKVAEESEGIILPTVTDLWKGANWYEREAYDMFGFRFEGHPNLKHLLLFDGFEGHPLRKDYPIGKRQKIPSPERKLT